jgi:molybdopterin/thiamine biosynthesis adenylyltransferase
MLAPWWERFPGRLDYELRALENAGFAVSRDEEAFRNGRLILHLRRDGDERLGTLTATYPDTFPYQRVEVYAPELRLIRHQNPIRKNLCLLGRGTELWHVADTLAGVLETQLPELLKWLGEPAAAGSRSEVPQGEPLSHYLTYAEDAVILIDSAWTIPESVSAGSLKVGFLPTANGRLHGAVLEVMDERQNRIATADPSWPRLFSGGSQEARWVRVPELPMEEHAESFHRRVSEVDARLARRVGPGQVELVGVLFREELRQRQFGDGWVFIARRATNSKGFRPGAKMEVNLIRSQRAGRTDLAVRLPAYEAANQSKICMFGLGCLGAPSALEFARSGVGELRILDRDSVDGGTIVRWPFGVPAIGRLKARVLVEFIRGEYPYTNVVGRAHTIGAPDLPLANSDRAVLDEFLTGVGLVFDATAELGLQHLLADLARQRDLPYVCVSATHGGWGGLVARIRPETGCWWCLQHALELETIPPPPADPDGQIEPQGCGALTYVGSSADLLEVSLMGVRVALATVCAGKMPTYGDYAWDVAVLALRDEEGRRVEPRWKTYPLRKDPSCPVCGRQ